MPEMYARYHPKLVEEAVNNSNHIIPSQERQIFAKHKSGYIFPIRIQLKMVVGALTGGIQFVALFKIDKKLISSDIAYILINKEKKL